MYKYRCIIQDYYLAPSGGDPFRLLANFFMIICRELAVFIFPTLLADFKDQIRKYFTIYYLLFYFNIHTRMIMLLSVQLFIKKNAKKLYQLFFFIASRSF